MLASSNPNDVKGEGEEAASREREQRWHHMVVDEQGEWWLLVQANIDAAGVCLLF